MLIKSAALASLQHDTQKQEYGLLLHLWPVGLHGSGGDVLSYGWMFSFHVPSVLEWQSAIITSVVSTLQFIISGDYTQLHKFVPCEPLLAGWWLLVFAELDVDSHGKARKEMPVHWSGHCQTSFLYWAFYIWKQFWIDRETNIMADLRHDLINYQPSDLERKGKLITDNNCYAQEC